MSRDELIDILIDLGTVPYEPPTWDDIHDSDVITSHDIVTTFDSLDEALELAGYDLANVIRGNHVPTDELIFDLRFGAAVLGHAPSYDQYQRFGEYAPTTAIARFGDAWADVLNAADLPPTGEPVDFDVDDVEVPEVSLVYTAIDSTTEPQPDSNDA